MEELNSKLVDRGQHPVFDTDTRYFGGTGYYLDEMNDRLAKEAEAEKFPVRNMPAGLGTS